jgi:DNA-binding SARP family transcriptional activator
MNLILYILLLMRKRVFLKYIFLLFISFLSQKGFSQSYGLRFASFEVLQDLRTSLDLNPSRTICPEKDLELSFELAFIPNQKVYFGYILRIVADDQRNIDLIYDNRTEAAGGRFKIIAGDKFSKIGFNISEKDLFGHWNKVILSIDKKKKKLTITSGNKTYTQDIDVTQADKYRFLFGSNGHKEFQTTDVPPMKLRNISLTQSGVVTNFWPLNDEEGIVSKDEKGKSNALVANPIWIKKMHRTWQSRHKLAIQGLVCTAMDASREMLYMVGEDSLYTYSVSNQKATAVKHQSGRLHLAKGNQALFDTISKTLFCYNVDQKIVSTYSFISHTWDKNFVYPIPANITEYWHSNKLYSASDSALYTFGGYGQLTFKNEVHKYSFSSKLWTDIKADSSVYAPRYLAGGGATSEGMYLLGGYGSASGQQILSPRFWYDLIFFDKKKETFKKLYELKTDLRDFTFANSMVVDKRNFYALLFPRNTYNSSLQLIQGSLDQPEIKTLASAIPYFFHDTHSFADLYYCPTDQKLVALTMTRTEDDKVTAVNIYSLNTPVIAVNQDILADTDSASDIILLGLGGVLFVIVISVGVYLAYKRKKLKGKIEGNASDAEPVDVIDKPYPGLNKNSIFLFGDMQVFDDQGTDMTASFTPLIKELFLVILLHSIRWERGINSEKLKELLWSDKTTESARNNRSVNLTKLKSILGRIKNCQVVLAGSHWKIVFENTNTRVDYQDYLAIIRSKKLPDRSTIEELINITRKGSFLLNLEYEWLDTFKSDISNEVVNTYLQFAGSMQISDDPEFLIGLANNIFYFDPANEEAMILKCRAFACLGKHSLAKSTFASFTKEYSNIYGEDFNRDLSDILNPNG